MSHADRLLACLKHPWYADGGWVSTAELLNRVPCIVHSRISDLRKRGDIIEHRTVGKGARGSQYRLVAALEEGGHPAVLHPEPVGDAATTHTAAPPSSSALAEGEADGRVATRNPSPSASASTPKDHPAGTGGEAAKTPAVDAPDLILGQLSLA